MKIDCHTHILPETLPRWTEKFGYGNFIYLEHHKPGHAIMIRGNQFFREIAENAWNPTLRIEEYARYNTDIQVISTVPVMFSYWALPKDGLAISQFLNDHIAEVIHAHPKHYIGLGTVPMQDAQMAIDELERLVKMGLKGIQIGSNINDDDLHENRFFPIFEACERLGLAVMVHPWNMMGEKETSRYWLSWLIGMPAETARAICNMIFGGVFRRLPKLRVMFAHAGGSFIPTLGRIKHGFKCRPDLVAIDNDIDPEDYLGQFWVDSVTHDKELLAYVLKKQGSSRLVLGSDYPFPLGDLEIGTFLEEMGLPAQDLENIFVNAPCEWLGIKQEELKMPEA